MTTKGAAHPGIVIRVPDNPDRERAIKAFKVMHELIPRFTDIVRTSAEDDGLQVIVRTDWPGPSTDGARVILPVEELFADVDPKNPCTCDNDAESCIYHITVGYLLHEAAHIVEGSTIVPDAEFCKELLKAFNRVGKVDGPLLVEVGVQKSAVFARIESWAHERKEGQVIDGSVLSIVSRFNRHAPGLCNAIEDARINLAMGERRTALPQQMTRVLESMVVGSIGGGGINAGPLGYQAGVGMLVQLEFEKDIAPMLTSETVKNCLADPTVQKLLNRVELRGVADSAALSVVICEHLRMKYGLFNDKVDEGGKARDTLKSGKDTDEDGVLKANQQVREDEAARAESKDLLKAARRAADARDKGSKEWLNREEPDRRPVNDQHPDMEAFLEALDATRKGGENEDLDDTMQQPGGNGLMTQSGAGHYRAVVLRPDLSVAQPSAVSTIRILDGYKYPAKVDVMVSAGYDSAIAGVLSTSQRLLADALGLNRRSANIPNLERGRLHGSKLAKVPTGARRVFRRIEKPAKRSYAVLIGVDMSGSTHGSTSEYLRLLAFGQATLLAKMGIPFSVVGHTGHQYGKWEGEDDYEWGSESIAEQVEQMYGSGRPALATLQLAKNFAEPWDTTAKVAVSSLSSSEQNLDGVTLQTYINMLLTQRATDRLLLYYTDGAMPAEDSTAQRRLLISECRRAKALSMLPDRRLHLIGVGVGTDSPKEYGMDTIEVSKDEGADGIARVVEGLAVRIARTIK